MLLTRKKGNLSTGLHIWVSPLAQPGDMMASLMTLPIQFTFVKIKKKNVKLGICTWEFIVFNTTQCLVIIVDLLGRIECLEVLFKAGAEVNCKDKKV